MDHSSLTIDSWKSYETMWGPYLRLAVLSLAFIYRRYSDKNYDITESGMEYCWTTSFLGWKLKMSPGRDEPIYIYNNHYKQHFIRETCYRGRVGAKIQETNSRLYSEIETGLPIIWNLAQNALFT